MEGELFDYREAPVRGKNWSTNQARRRRHAARQRVVERKPEGCPHPEKPAYDKGDVAERRLQERRLGPGLEMYDCRCGFSHNGHQ